MISLQGLWLRWPVGGADAVVVEASVLLGGLCSGV